MKKILSLILALCLGCGLMAGCEEAAVTGGPVDGRTLSLAQETVTVVLGQESVKLEAQLSQGKGAFQWTSSDESIATVDEKGRVTGLAVGTCDITVTCGTLAAATCQVTVVLPETVPVFTADPTGQGIAKTLAVGGKLQLDGSIRFGTAQAEAKLTYQSKDPAIATVSDTGEITGVQAGTTQIQVVADYMGLQAHMTVEITVLAE